MSNQRDFPERNIPQLNAMIRAILEHETLAHPFWVSGYVTRRFLSDSGHLYFDITDDDSSISCMLRDKVRSTIGFDIANGMDIAVLGSIRVYERRAQVQIDVEAVRYLNNPQSSIDASLLQHLETKGLWPRKKKPMPDSIKRIGLITSKQSEALHDFEDAYRSDGGTAIIKLSDVRLQGDQAVYDIVEGIKRLNQAAEVDIIVLTRGGGRTSELGVFNNLQIAEAICLSNIPVVTGIGHQRNHTLADEVADSSQITPTAAATFLARKKQPSLNTTNPPFPRWVLLAGTAGLFLITLLLVLLLSRTL